MGYRVDLLSPAHIARVAEIAACGAGARGRAAVALAPGDRIRAFLRGEGQPYDRAFGAVVADEAEPGYALGYALVGVVEPLAASVRPGHAFLVEICVDPLYRRRGAGSALARGLLDHATLTEGVGVYATVPEPAWDVMGLLRSAGRGRGLVVVPGSRFESATFPPVPFAILARGQAPDRHIFHFPAPARARVAAPRRQASPRPGRRKWSYGDADRRAS